MNFRSERRKAYRLSELAVGNSITLPASLAGQFQHARITVSEYNRKNGTVIKTRTQADGSLLIHHSGTDDPGVELLHPTKAEWDSYIKGMQPGQSFAMYGNHCKRFTEFKEWCKALVASGVAVEAEEEPSGTLTITRSENSRQ